MLREVNLIVVLEILERRYDHMFLFTAGGILLNSLIILFGKLWRIYHRCLSNQRRCDALLVPSKVYFLESASIFVLVADVLPDFILKRDGIHFFYFGEELVDLDGPRKIHSNPFI